MRGTLGIVVLAACGRLGFDSSSDASRDSTAPTITWRSTTNATVPQSGGSGVMLAEPPGSEVGDVLVAVLAMGNSGSPAMPDFTAPSGWTQIRRDDSNNDTTVISYWHAIEAVEPPTYLWAFDQQAEGVAWISAYEGVSTSDPIDIAGGSAIENSGPSYTAPAITTSGANELLVVTFAAHLTTDNGSTTWLAPMDAAVRALLNNGTTRSGIGFDVAMASPGPVGVITATASVAQDYGLAGIIALRPAL